MGKQWKTAGKQAQAEKKGTLFTKLSKEIQVAVRLAGPHPENNHRLKLALETARSHSLPKDTIERAIAKGRGQKEGELIEEVVYEGFGPHGVAVIALCLTDNRARTVSEIRLMFKKYKGRMGESGSVMWMFDKVSLVQARKAVYFSSSSLDKASEGESVEEEALLAGAENIEPAEDSYLFYGHREDLKSLQENLIKQGWEVMKVELIYRPKTRMTLDEKKKQDLQVLLDCFDEYQDCKAVYTNV